MMTEWWKSDNKVVTEWWRSDEGVMTEWWQRDDSDDRGMTE